MCRTLLTLALAAASAGAPGPAGAEWCRAERHREARGPEWRERCRPEDRLVPHDADAPRGGRPGFYRIGPDTELRIDGRVQGEYGVRR